MTEKINVTQDLEVKETFSFNKIGEEMTFIIAEDRNIYTTNNNDDWCRVDEKDLKEFLKARKEMLNYEMSLIENMSRKVFGHIHVERVER